MWKWKQKWDSEQIVLVCWALGVTRLQAVGTRWVYISLRMVIGSFKKIFVLSCKQQWLNILCSTTFFNLSIAALWRVFRDLEGTLQTFFSFPFWDVRTAGWKGEYVFIFLSWSIWIERKLASELPTSVICLFGLGFFECAHISCVVRCDDTFLLTPFGFWKKSYNFSYI